MKTAINTQEKKKKKKKKKKTKLSKKKKLLKMKPVQPYVYPTGQGYNS